MSFVGKFFRTSTLFGDLMKKDPGSLSTEQLDELQAFVNKGRSIVLLRDQPLLEGIISSWTDEWDSADRRQDAVDIVVCFIQEGGSLGTPEFRLLIERMVQKGTLGEGVLGVLENKKLIPPAKLSVVNADGVKIKEN